MGATSTTTGTTGGDRRSSSPNENIHSALFATTSFNRQISDRSAASEGMPPLSVPSLPPTRLASVVSSDNDPSSLQERSRSIQAILERAKSLMTSMENETLLRN